MKDRETNRIRALALALAACMVLCFALAGCSLPGRAQSKIKKTVEEMSTVQKVTQMMMLRFKTWGTGDAAKNVTELNPEIQSLLRKHSFGGVIVFLENMQGAEQGTRLIDSMRVANQLGGAKTDLLIGIDQEGGYITRLATGTQLPGNMALGAANDTANTQRAASIVGEELKALGIDLDFAPVLDLNNNPNNPIIGLRSFSDDPQIASNMGSAFIKGLQSAKTAAAIKHFPGHGNTDVDSHSGLPLINSSMAELEKYELLPFTACIKSGADVVMTAHIQYPQIETQTYVSRFSGEKISLPATLSKTMITGLLREKLGFKGVVVTDSMVMDAIAQHFDRKDAIKLAILAGADMLTVPVETRTAAEIGELERCIDDVVAMVVGGEIPMESIDKAVTRILTLKEKYGRLEPAKENKVEENVKNAQAVLGSKAHHDAEWEITEKTVTLVKNEGGTLPIKAGGKTVLVCPYASELKALEYGVKKLKDAGILAQDADVSCLCYNGMTAEAEKIAEGAANIVAVSAMYSDLDLDPARADWSAFLDKLCDAVHAQSGRFTVISAQLPYDLARYQKADALLAVYNGRGMNSDPGIFAVDTLQYAPNIPVGVYTAFGGCKPTGKLPVAIPKLDASYRCTTEILYPTGHGLSW